MATYSRTPPRPRQPRAEAVAGLEVLEPWVPPRRAPWEQGQEPQHRGCQVLEHQVRPRHEVPGLPAQRPGALGVPHLQPAAAQVHVTLCEVGTAYDPVKGKTFLEGYKKLWEELVNA